MTTPTSDEQDPTLLGQQERDWEASYKGLQRKYNELERTLTSKDEALQKITDQLSIAKSSGQDALTSAQAQLAQLQTDLKNKDNAFQLAQTQTQTLQQKLASLETKETLRGKLTALKAADLIPLVDAGDLTFDSLEDDAVKAKVEGFRERLRSLGVTQTPAQDPKGAAVPNLLLGSQDTTPDLDKMFQWLMDPANQDHPDYNKTSTVYYQSLK